MAISGAVWGGPYLAVEATALQRWTPPYLHGRLFGIQHSRREAVMGWSTRPANTKNSVIASPPPQPKPSSHANMRIARRGNERIRANNANS